MYTKHRNRVLKLKRALYGLVESPKCWNETIDLFLKNRGFQRSEYDSCLYYKKDCWLVIYVDDILIIGKDKSIIEDLKAEFNAKDLGEIKRFLGMEVIRNSEEIAITQEGFINKILERFGMEECRGAQTPMEIQFNLLVEKNEEIIKVPYRELIGSLMYLTVTSRPDITFAVSYLSRYLDKPTTLLWTAGKRILRYLKETKGRRLIFRKSGDYNLYGYSDSDWGGDKTDRKSVSGAIIFQGNNPISWFSKKQNCVALSSAESEYIAAAATAQDLLNLKGIAKHLKMNAVAKLLVDNKGAIHMTKSFENSKRTKHIDIRVHFIKDLITKEIITIEYVETNKNVADLLTKSLCKEKLYFFIDNFLH